MSTVTRNLCIKTTKLYFFLIVCLLAFIRCGYVYKAKQDDVVARVGDFYLYKSDLEQNVPVFLSKADSIIHTNNYINNWAKNQLLFQQATLNLDLELQTELENLVEAYKSDLWGNTYKEFIVKSALDTTLVQQDEIKSYYNKNKNNFKANQTLIKIRYISLPKENINLDKISSRFVLFEENDKRFIDSLSYQYSTYNLNDNYWLSKREAIKIFPMITQENFNNYLKKSQFFTLKHTSEVYLLFVENFVLRNEVAPLKVVEKTIRKIIFNKRKLDFIRQFDKEILQDAIQTNKFEIYH